MKYVLLFLVSFPVFSQIPYIEDVLEQDKQRILVKQSGAYDSAILKMDELDCNTDIEFIGKYSIITVEKKFIKQKDRCILIEPINKEQISLFKEEVRQEKFSSKEVLFYLGAGPSSSSYEDNQMDGVKNATFNYSFGIFKKGDDSLIGAIYHVSAYRVFGSFEMPNGDEVSVEDQYNINLLGFAYRKYLTTTEQSSPYLRLDAGLAWGTMGNSVILSPFENPTPSANFGANIGLGMAIKTGFGSVNIDIYQTLVKSDYEQVDSGMTNFTLGFLF